MSCCKGRRRFRRCLTKRAKHTFVAGANGCSNFNNVLVCSFKHHKCRGGCH
jgi:hypothetical protein